MDCLTSSKEISGKSHYPHISLETPKQTQPFHIIFEKIVFKNIIESIDTQQSFIITHLSDKGILDFDIDNIEDSEEGFNMNGLNWNKVYNIKVIDDASNLIEELYSYEWETDINGNVQNTPKDEYNHALDALRYVVMELLNAKQGRAGSYTLSAPSLNESTREFNKDYSKRSTYTLG